MSLNKPIVELIEDYFANYSKPEEQEHLSKLFRDTRKEYSRILARIEYLDLKYKRLRSYLNQDEWDKRRRLERIFSPKIRQYQEKLPELKPFTLQDFSDKGPRVCWDSLMKINNGFTSHPQFIGFPSTWEGYVRHRVDIVRDKELLLHQIIRDYLKKEGIQSPKIEHFLSLRKKTLDYFRATKETLLLRISEESSFSELRSKIRHFSQSNVKDQYFDKLLSLAKTKEEIFFVVKHGIRCPCWPKAVRRLAQIKDLSPIEKIN